MSSSNQVQIGSRGLINFGMVKEESEEIGEYYPEEPDEEELEEELDPD